MAASKALPRDVFINEVRAAALENRDIYFMSADLGALALDRFRTDLPGQFIHAGISEQNMVDVAAGLALNGKTVYIYAMAPFVTLRCFEQIKVAIASMSLPLAIVGVGAGYSYDDAGPTHYATEDISCMRALAGIEILTPGDTQSVVETARLTHSNPGFRYIRLDRDHLPDVYEQGDRAFIEDGLVEVDKGEDVCIMTAGYMLQKAREARRVLSGFGIDAGIVDVYRLKPIDAGILKSIVAPYRAVITLEEHFLSGGLGGALVETLADNGLLKRVKRIGIEDRYYCENGGRAYLHTLARIDVENIVATVREFAARVASIAS